MLLHHLRNGQGYWYCTVGLTSALCITSMYGEPHLDTIVAKVLAVALAGDRVYHFHSYLALALGQQLVPNPVLVRKVALAALVGVVLAQDAVGDVAAMVPAAGL